MATSWHFQHRVPDPKTFGGFSDSNSEAIVGRPDSCLTWSEERPGLPAACQRASDSVRQLIG